MPLGLSPRRAAQIPHQGSLHPLPRYFQTQPISSLSNTQQLGPDSLSAPFLPDSLSSRPFLLPARHQLLPRPWSEDRPRARAPPAPWLGGRASFRTRTYGRTEGLPYRRPPKPRVPTLGSMPAKLAPPRRQPRPLALTEPRERRASRLPGFHSGWFALATCGREHIRLPQGNPSLPPIVSLRLPPPLPVDGFPPSKRWCPPLSPSFPWRFAPPGSLGPEQDGIESSVLPVALPDGGLQASLPRGRGRA